MDTEVVQSHIRKLNLRVAEIEQQVKEVFQSTFNIESLAGKRVPYKCVVNITIDQGEDQLVSGSTQVTRAGPFLAETVLASFRVGTMRAGGLATLPGRYLPLGSRSNYPYVWPLAATGTRCELPPLDFEWGYNTNDSDRARQDNFVPGDLFDRFDNDGILPVADIFAPGAQITFEVNPFRAVGNGTPWNDADGVSNFVFTATFSGYKIIQPGQF